MSGAIIRVTASICYPSGAEVLISDRTADTVGAAAAASAEMVGAAIAARPGAIGPGSGALILRVEELRFRAQPGEF